MEIRFRGNLSRVECWVNFRRQAFFFYYDSRNVTKVIIGQMSLFIAFIACFRYRLSLKAMKKEAEYCCNEDK